jgi:hypothetical protein
MRASKRATNHFILNWNKMFDEGDGNGNNVGKGDGNEGDG